MLDAIITGLITWVIASFVIRVFLLATQRSGEESSTNLSMPSAKKHVRIKIHMEEINGWWYGWFQNSDGSEAFVSQGTSYDAALNNCTSTINERNPDLSVNIIFEMKNAISPVQN